MKMPAKNNETSSATGNHGKPGKQYSPSPLLAKQREKSPADDVTSVRSAWEMQWSCTPKGGGLEAIENFHRACEIIISNASLGIIIRGFPRAYRQAALQGNALQADPLMLGDTRDG